MRTRFLSALAVVLHGCASTAASPSATADAGGPSATADGGDASATADSGGSPARGDGGDAGPVPRSPPSQGGTSGTVDSVSTPGFTLTTAAGQAVTVDETSTTVYQDGTTPASASAIATGETVLVLGIVNSTAITATQVTVEPADAGAATPFGDAGVVPFQPGAPSVTQQVGQVPANYKEGQGTIVAGTTADQATEAALAAFPGIVVDRVVLLSAGGDYEVHCISVNWPHHIFVDQGFNVVGAD